MVAFTSLRAALLSLAASSVLATPVMTPHGARDSASVHLIPEGGEVKVTESGEVHLIDGSGNVIHVSSNTNTNANANAKRAAGDPSVLQNVNKIVTEASWTNTGNSPISLLQSNLTVPAIPLNAAAQTLFLYDSLQPATADGGLQPVLQYGPSAAGGGAFWSVATWYVVGGQSYFTTPIQVTPGQAVVPTISLTSARSGTYNYIASFAGIPSTSMQATNSAQLVTAAVALEGYALDNANSFPAGQTTFRNIILRTQGVTPTVTYTTSGSNAKGVTGHVDKNGATGAQFTITNPGVGA